MAQDISPQETLVVIWSSRDPDVAHNLAFMYAGNSLKKSWWPRVVFVVWGPSAQALAEDEGLQKGLAGLKEAGVELQACKACADRYGVSDQLQDMGVDVIYMGQPLTHYLRQGCHVLTF